MQSPSRCSHSQPLCACVFLASFSPSPDGGSGRQGNRRSHLCLLHSSFRNRRLVSRSWNRTCIRPLVHQPVMAFALVMRPLGTADLLLYLLRDGPAVVTKILDDTGMSTDTFYDALGKLVDLGYAYREEEPGRPKRVYAGLTRAGEAVAQSLAPAEALLKGTLEVWSAELEALEGRDDPSTFTRWIGLLRLLGDRAFSLGRWKDARGFGQRLVELGRRAGDRRAEAEGHALHGRIAQKQDAHEEALASLTKAGSLADAAGAQDVASEAEYLSGALLERQSRWQEAARRYANAEELARRAHDTLRAARAREGGARVLAQQGRLEEATSVYMEVVTDYERMSAGEDFARACSGLGSTSYHAKRPDALSWFEKSIGAARREGNLRMEAYARSNAAAPLIEAREFRKAESYLRRAKDVFNDLGERFGFGAAELNLANLLWSQRKWSDAEDAFDE